MPHSSAEGATEPLAAIAALFAVGVGLTVYAGALPDPGGTDSVDPEAVLGEVRAAATTDGVLDPDAVSTAVVPAGWRVNVTLETRIGRVTVGPEPAPNAATASRPLTVALAPDVRGPGRLSVAVWR
jgi:hypothetical protein